MSYLSLIANYAHSCNTVIKAGITVCLLMILTTGLSGQEWQELSNNGVPFESIQKKMNKRFEGKSTRVNDKQFSSEYKQYKRWEHFWSYRVSQEGELQTEQPLVAFYASINSVFHPDNANWRFIGPKSLPKTSNSLYPGVGRVNCLAVNPKNKNILWAGTPSGGLWRSKNYGETWNSIGVRFPAEGVSKIVFSPNEPHSIYVATGDSDHQVSNSIGLLKSNDGGESWLSTGLTYQNDEKHILNDIYIDKSNPDFILVAGSEGILKSTDGGIKFHLVHANPSYTILKSFESKTLYASCKKDVVISNNNGSTWKSIKPNLKGQKVKIANTRSNPNLLMALDQTGRLYKTKNNGAKWQRIKTFDVNYKAQPGGYNMAISISPIDSNLILIGGVNGWRSRDGGITWDKYLNGAWTEGDDFFYVHPDHHSFTFESDTSNIIYSTNDGGVHRGDLSKDSKWEDLSNSLYITQYYGISSDPQDKNYMIAGAQDNDINRSEAGIWYDEMNNTDGIDGLINFNNSDIAYAAAQTGYLIRTKNRWKSTLECNTPYIADFVWPVKMNQKNPNTIYGGFNKLFVSYDECESWISISDSVKTNGQNISKIALSKTDTNTIYAAYGNNLMLTTNHGKAWTNITVPSKNKISGITVHSKKSNQVYLTVGGLEANIKVFMSSDYGKTWTNISKGIPNTSVNCITYDDEMEGKVYVGTDNGVYEYTPKNRTFNPFNNKLPNVIVNDLEIHYKSRIIRAATFGRGIWESPLINND